MKPSKLKDLGDLKNFLRLEIARSTNGIHISQRRYALDVIFYAGLFVAIPFYYTNGQKHEECVQ